MTKRYVKKLKLKKEVKTLILNILLNIIACSGLILLMLLIGVIENLNF